MLFTDNGQLTTDQSQNEPKRTQAKTPLALSRPPFLPLHPHAKWQNEPTIRTRLVPIPIPGNIMTNATQSDTMRQIPFSLNPEPSSPLHVPRNPHYAIRISAAVPPRPCRDPSPDSW